MDESTINFPIPSTYARIIARVLNLPERDLGRLLQDTDLSTDILMPADETHISGEQQLRIMQNGRRIMARPEFGLILGQQLQPSAHGPLGYLALSSPDLMSSLESLRDYLPVRLPLVALDLKPEPDWIRCQLKINIDAHADEQRVAAECFVMVIQSLVEEVLGRQVTEATMSFTHQTPDYVSCYAQYLHSPFQFDSDSTSYLIPASLAHAPNVAGDTSAYRLAQQLCNKLLEQSPRSASSMAERVKTLLLMNPIESVSEPDVAQALYVSKRTLGRRLAGENTSYRKIRDQLLGELARRYLLESSQTVESVAAHMGYSDSAAFRKAFRRWTGMAPADYRKLHAAAGLFSSGDPRPPGDL